MVSLIRKVRDPIHNIIYFRNNELDNLLWDLIQTPEFQRLRRIKQLGFSEFVYPGATHSRFSHSLGVMHLAKRLIQTIKEQENCGNILKPYTAICAALLHDLGHGPFSHAFEEVGNRLQLKSVNHEIITRDIILDSNITKILDKHFSGLSRNITSAIEEHADIYSSVISGQFDADRLDYMQRDQHMTGTSLGTVDFEWLLANIEISNGLPFPSDAEIPFESPVFILNHKATAAAEAYALNLFQLYPAVYFHKTTRGIEMLFTELMCKVISNMKNGDHLNLGTCHPLYRYATSADHAKVSLLLDDGIIWATLPILMDSKDKLIANLSQRLYYRNLFKLADINIKYEIIATEILSNDEQKRKLDMAYLSLKPQIDQWNSTNEIDDWILLDKVERKAYKTKSNTPSGNIYIRSRNGAITPLTDISPVVNQIGPFYEIRAYVAQHNGKAEKQLTRIVQNLKER